MSYESGKWTSCPCNSSGKDGTVRHSGRETNIMWAGMEFPACCNHIDLYMETGAVVIAPPVPPVPVPPHVNVPVRTAYRAAPCDEPVIKTIRPVKYKFNEIEAYGELFKECEKVSGAPSPSHSPCVCEQVGKEGRTHFGVSTKIKYGESKVFKATACENHLKNYLDAGWEIEEGEEEGKIGSLGADGAYIDGLSKEMAAKAMKAIHAIDTSFRQTEMIETMQNKIDLLEYALEYIREFDSRAHKVTAAKALKMVREVARASLEHI